ncbi:MAG: hypothetical protein RMJ87_04075 [Cytophagales bacterium]|nr:hypothetical protein [Bernardetiaceae bacterium]MDW8204186.1 hypothetical protein [Cytophagales bacterium]
MIATKQIKIIGLILIASYIATTQAQIPQDLSGKWVGFITQKGSDVAEQYYFELNLNAQQAGKWSGSSFSFAKQKGGRRYILRLALEATLSNDTLIFQEIRELEYVNEISPKNIASSYCFKRGRLHWAVGNDGKGVWHGNWEGTVAKSGTACNPGMIELRRFEPSPNEVEDSLITIKNGRITGLLNRQVKAGHQLFFTGTQLTLKIFDEGKEDGDVISLLYNNRWILRNYKLKNEPRIIKVQASPTQLNNFLICYAENVGKQPPCTTAVIVSDSKKEKKVILNADLETCDIVYFEIDN